MRWARSGCTAAPPSGDVTGSHASRALSPHCRAVRCVGSARRGAPRPSDPAAHADVTAGHHADPGVPAELPNDMGFSALDSALGR